MAQEPRDSETDEPAFDTSKESDFTPYFEPENNEQALRFDVLRLMCEYRVFEWAGGKPEDIPKRIGEISDVILHGPRSSQLVAVSDKVSSFPPRKATKPIRGAE